MPDARLVLAGLPNSVATAAIPQLQKPVRFIMRVQSFR
jgi:hypothetical protein